MPFAAAPGTPGAAEIAGVGSDWLWHIVAWPLVVKVPVLIVGLMVTVTTSQVVPWRFAQDQKSNLELLIGAYLDGLSAAVLPAAPWAPARGHFR